MVLDKIKHTPSEKEMSVKGMDNVELGPNPPVPNSIKQLFLNE